MPLKLPSPRLALASVAGLILGSALVLPAHAQGEELIGPGPVPVDRFHPERDTPAEPAYGGRVIVHLSTMPRGLNRVLENTAVISWMGHEFHETLIQRDWETWQRNPNLCHPWDTEDQLVLVPEAAGRYRVGGKLVAERIGEGERERYILFGESEKTSTGWRITPRSKLNPLAETIDVAADDVLNNERGTVFTFYLKDGLKWHDGHVLDAEDIEYTWKLYGNPHVACDETRSNQEKVLHAEALNRLTVRFIYENQYFMALDSVGSLCILPRHLYDPTDPDHADYDPEARLTEEDLGAQVNTNSHNREFVGLGPYRVTEFGTEYIELERFDDYAVSERVGYFDTIRYRYIRNDDTAFQALINGELDFFGRLNAADYLGEGTAQPAFTERFYKGHNYTGVYGYHAWNLKRPKFADKRVRQALAHAYDSQAELEKAYHGMAIQVTGSQNYFGPGYDHSVKPLEYNPARAEELLAEAGWYDRDGDGIIDRDGVPFEFAFLLPNGSKTAESFCLRYQEAMGKIGIKMTLEGLEWATFMDRVLDREFDVISMGWSPPLESDLEQLWHSKNDRPRTSNRGGFNNPEADRLIEAIQIELDDEKRAQLHHELHRLLFEEQPYLFWFSPPTRYAMNRDLRGFQGFKIAPGYSIRRWYWPAGTEGTRSTPER